MATASYNVEQITNFDIQNEDAPTFEINGVEYVQYTFPKPICKLGYCCEPKGIGQTIYLYSEDDEVKGKPFIIGKTGMFEVQPELISKMGEDNIMEQVEIKVNMKKIDLPKHIKFTLDYAYGI